MLRKIALLALAGVLLGLAPSSNALGWGAYHAGYTRYSPYSGFHHYGYTEAYRGGYAGSRGYSGYHYGGYGGYVGYHYGGYHYGGYSGYGGDSYRYGYYRRY